jgi:hypothetical protein
MKEKISTGNNKFKKEMIFALIWIGTYFLLVILANILSNIVIKIPDSINALVELLFSVVVIAFLRKKKLLSYYGINTLKKLNFKNLLFCIPMIIISFANLLFGIHINYSWQQIILISIEMLGIGFSEEMLFRSFLIRAIQNKNQKVAILLPSIIFGVAHFANLFGGADVIGTLLQSIYATAFGVMCSIFFCKTNNIIPCMICHSVIDVTSTFLPNNLSLGYQYLYCIAFIVPSLFYALYLYKTKRTLIKIID